jgi:hypothetical protein
MSDAERQSPPRLHCGQTLWRVQMTHFSPWDYNFPSAPPDDGCSDDKSRMTTRILPASGSIIECTTQVLRTARSRALSTLRIAAIAYGGTPCAYSQRIR